MRIQPVQPIEKYRSSQNDLYPRCTIQAEKAANTPDAESLTHDRAIAFARDCDSSFKVDLNSKDIPLFLYNQNGKLT